MDKIKEEAVILFLKSQTDTLRKYEDLINKERVNGDVVTLTSRVFLLNLLDNLACSEVIIYGYKINVLEKENIDFLYYYLIELKKIIYIYLCHEANLFDDLLLELYLDNFKIIDFVCAKWHIKHDASLDNYLQMSLLNYQGPETLGVYLVKEIRNFKNGKMIKSPQVIKRVSLKNEVTNEKIEERPYDELKKVVALYAKEEKGDSFTELFHYLHIEETLDFEQLDDYKKYILLRFGFIDNKYLQIPEIAEGLGITKEVVVAYEKKTAYLMKECFNYQAEAYIKLVKSNS